MMSTSGIIFQGRRALIMQQRSWGMKIGHYLAQNLQKEGATLACFTEKIQTHKFVLNQTEINYTQVANYEEVMGDPYKVAGVNEISLSDICEELKLDSIWPIISSEHNLVRSYKDKWYFCDIRNVSDEYMVACFKAMYLTISRMLKSFKPDFVLSPNIVASYHLILERLCELNDIRIFCVSETKVRGISCFNYSHDLTKCSLLYRLNCLSNNLPKKENVIKAKNYIAKFREILQKPLSHERSQTIKSNTSIFTEIKNLLKEVIFYYVGDRGKYYNPIPNIGATLDNKSPKYLIRDFFTMKYYRRQALNFKKYSNLDLIKTKYVYYPLQFQPEAVMDTMCPLMNNQIEIIRVLGRAMPGDLTLVVKEHPAMLDKRDPKDYKTIANYANVKLVAPTVSSEELLRNCELVVSCGGTSLMEAAIYKKPGLSLGPHGLIEALPNIIKCSSLVDVTKNMVHALGLNLNSTEYEKKLENYITAAYEIGFDFDYFGVWAHDVKSNINDLWGIYKIAIMEYLVEKNIESKEDLSCVTH